MKSPDWEYLEDEKDRLEHFVALGSVFPFMWIDRAGQPVDLRKVTYQHACSIRDWMVTHSRFPTYYSDLDQFRVVSRRIKNIENRWEFARKALTRRCH